MQQILQAAQQMQAQLANAQEALADSEVTGTAGGGAVRAVVSGQGELVDLSIDPSVVDVSDPAETASTIADLVLAAVRDAGRAAGDLQQQSLGAVAGNVPGFDLSALGLGGQAVPGQLDDEEDEDEEDDEDGEDDGADGPHDTGRTT
ncbi:MAG: YbaB/EbfC family nucleoid-associated protein [Nocardiopsaceae bacterium]|nr:YbaB/EbfC family nucleoid-associated protein [Nocardiopsaceae bacterium]